MVTNDLDYKAYFVRGMNGGDIEEDKEKTDWVDSALDNDSSAVLSPPNAAGLGLHPTSPNRYERETRNCSTDFFDVS